MTRLGDIVSHERGIAMLLECVARGRLHHALLFSGPEGVGKRSTALALAAYQLCESPEAGDSCGTCGPCVQVAAGTHSDLHVETLREKKDGKRSRNVGIDQIRELQTFLGYRPLAGGRKIVIVDEAQALSEEAQNAFLKTLEEPPGDTLIVLVAHNASALTATVRSRCQRVAFGPIPDAVLETLLRERHGRSAEEARRLVAWAEGSLGDALGVDAGALREAEEHLTRLLDGGAGGGHASIVAAAEATAAATGSLGMTLLLKLLRRRLRASVGLDAAPIHTADLSSVLDAADAAYRATVDLRDNANPAIAGERMWLRVGMALAS